MIKRITILGESSVYVPQFIMSLISHNILPKEVVLYGQTPKKIEIVSSFCQRLVDRSDYPSTIIPSTHLEEAVTDAQYVLNQIRAGGMKAASEMKTLSYIKGNISILKSKRLLLSGHGIIQPNV